MVSAQLDVNFCSECVYAKEIECEDGIKIHCMKPWPVVARNGNLYIKSFNVFKKLNSTACVEFKKK